MQVSPTAPSDFFWNGFWFLNRNGVSRGVFCKILEWFWDIFEAFFIFSENILNFFKISLEIDYIIEDNGLKVGKYVPGVNIEIKDKKVCKNSKCILVLAWNFFKGIKKDNGSLSKNFISVKDLEKKKLS